MTADSTVHTAGAGPTQPHSSTAPLAVWCAIQLLLIGLAVARVPLAARYPEPAEQLAPQLLLCGQAIVASLLFPWLLRDVRTTAQLLTAALPFQLAAAFLSGMSIREMAPAIGCVGGLVVVLTVWAPLLRSSLSQSLGIAAASCLTLGGGMLRYLRVEYSGGTGETVPHTWETATPLPSTLQALAGHAPLGGWILLAVLAVAGITIRFNRRRQSTAKAVNP